jgi:hypothetical protein
VVYKHPAKWPDSTPIASHDIQVISDAEAKTLSGHKLQTAQHQAKGVINFDW